MTYTPKKRVHFRLSCEAIARLDEVVKIANTHTIRKGVITRSDITDSLILKHTENSIDILDQEIKTAAKQLLSLQDKRDVLQAEKDKAGIK